MSGKPYCVVDAFTDRPMSGNPAAVVFDADDLDAPTMQAVAREMNLSETVFVLPPDRADSDYHVRIFTPRNELPFAGHPTLATAFAMLETGRVRLAPDAPLLRQSCAAGVIPVAVDRDPAGTRLTMTQLPPVHRDVAIDPVRLAAACGVPPLRLAATPISVVSTGVPWLIVPLLEPGDVAGARPNLAEIEALSLAFDCDGVLLFARHRQGSTPYVKVRNFAPRQGIAEDPVCGSGHGAVCAYLAAHGLLPESGSYDGEQGAEVARPGTVHATARGSTDDGTLRVEIGGRAVMAAEGRIFLHSV